MKQIFLSLLTLLTWAIPATAQDKTNTSGRLNSDGAHSYIGITGGLSAPMGNIAKGDYIDNNSGYFGSGGNIGLTGVYFIGRSRFGISALVSYQGFATKGGQNLADGYKDGYSLDSTTLYSKGSNHAVNIMVGPYYSISVARHFSIDVLALGGLTNVHRAGYQVAFEDADYDITQLEATTSAFGWKIGIAPRYNFGKHLGLMLTLDYFSSSPNFDVKYTSFHPTDNAEEPGISNQPINKTLPTSYHQSLHGINTNLTLYFRL
ncbi:MAG: hypothetical protein JWQ38_1956 [Flavipsychrobacter sp.]|nr:hypothetical protein [Flavipsychrobacter sp.]